jgi:propanediol utilization protein
LIIGDVLLSVAPSFAPFMCIDTDEAKAAQVQTGPQGFLEGIQGEA